MIRRLSPTAPLSTGRGRRRWYTAPGWRNLCGVGHREEKAVFDTPITIIGNVLTAPEWRRTSQSGQLVANFKVASTARRLDKANNRWVDGNSLRVRVNCWRRLAEGVASSIMVGDPV